MHSQGEGESTDVPEYARDRSPAMDNWYSD